MKEYTIHWLLILAVLLIKNIKTESLFGYYLNSNNEINELFYCKGNDNDCEKVESPAPGYYFNIKGKADKERIITCDGSTCKIDIGDDNPPVILSNTQAKNCGNVFFDSEEMCIVEFFEVSNYICFIPGENITSTIKTTVKDVNPGNFPGIRSTSDIEIIFYNSSVELESATKSNGTSINVNVETSSTTTTTATKTLSTSTITQTPTNNGSDKIRPIFIITLFVSYIFYLSI